MRGGHGPSGGNNLRGDDTPAVQRGRDGAKGVGACGLSEDPEAVPEPELLHPLAELEEPRNENL